MTFNGTSAFSSLPSGLYVQRKYVFEQAGPTSLPQLSVQAKATILSTVARTSFTQIFQNPSPHDIPELQYRFPLYDGVSVIDFTCTINKDRVIKGVVQDREKALATYENAKSQGQTAGLLEQHSSAGDVFTTIISNVPAGAEIEVKIVVVGELKHDAEIDGIRFTIPTHIAPRYGSFNGWPSAPTFGNPNTPTSLGTFSAPTTARPTIAITVDVEMPAGSILSTSSIRSPSHPRDLEVTLETPSTSDAQSAVASATLALGTMPLHKDFILQIVAANIDNPVAILETHPSIPNQRALMTTLVPKFNLPQQQPEIVFLCDRSGSMGLQGRINNLRFALQLFLKSLTPGIKFNICGFGSRFQFIFPESRPYNAENLAMAMAHAESMNADLGGTEMMDPLVQAFERRQPDMNLEVFLLTDGEVWDQESLIRLVNERVVESKFSIRLFTLAIGNSASHSLTQSLARAGRGFSQAIVDNETMGKKVIRMLKGALSPPLHDYTLEVKYKSPDEDADESDGFELVDLVADLAVDVSPAREAAEDTVMLANTPFDAQSNAQLAHASTKPTSFFDPDYDADAPIVSSGVTAPRADLPAVTFPKILQTPSEIPALFPFSRTSIYLLLSPETIDKTPESIILRATSKHGPLELEIPVSTTTSGETIHQLAARKAMHELEEGRGWIFQAKEKNDDHLLQSKYKEQFPAMVEREAVRLGVQFQVAGKYCYFVAVEQNGESCPRIVPVSAHQHVSPTRPHSSSPLVGAQLFGHAVSQSPGALPGYPPQRGQLFGSTAGPQVLSRHQAVPNSFGSPRPMGPLFSSQQPSGTMSKVAATPSGLFSTAHHAQSPHATVPSSAGSRFESTLHMIIGLQDISGFWAQNEELLQAMSTTEERFRELLSRVPASHADAASVATTIAVIVYLRKQLASDKDMWEMIVDKALAWLDSVYVATPEAAKSVLAEAENLLA